MQIESRLTAAILTAIKDLYGQDVPEKMVQLSATKKEFEGHLTLVVFPFLKMSRKKPEDTAQEIGQYLVEQLPDVVARPLQRHQGVPEYGHRRCLLGELAG